jgi:hypothetical protein
MDIIKHLEGRGIDTRLYSMNIDHDQCVVSFYLYNLSGRLVGYQTYRPNVLDKKVKNDPKSGRYYTYLPKDGTLGVFGLETLNPNDDTIFVTEGVFKAAVLHRLGFNAIATLTSTPKHLKNWFYVMKKRYNLIAIGDNDDAGKKLVNIVGNGFQSYTDLDEMTNSEILTMLNSRLTT